MLCSGRHVGGEDDEGQVAVVAEVDVRVGREVGGEYRAHVRCDHGVGGDQFARDQ
jgi:hypothetical protein